MNNESIVKVFSVLINDLSRDTWEWFKFIGRMLWTIGIAYYIGQFVVFIWDVIVTKYQIPDASSHLGSTLAWAIIVLYLITKSFNILPLKEDGGR